MCIRDRVTGVALALGSTLALGVGTALGSTLALDVGTALGAALALDEMCIRDSVCPFHVYIHR